jgi:hypothetical protein
VFCCRKLNGPDFGPTSQERDVDAYQPTAPPLEENAEDCWRRAHQASPMVTFLFLNYYFSSFVGNNLRGQVVVVFPVSFCVMYSNQILRQKFTKIRFCEPFIFAFLDPENPDEIRI